MCRPGFLGASGPVPVCERRPGPAGPAHRHAVPVCEPDFLCAGEGHARRLPGSPKTPVGQQSVDRGPASSIARAIDTPPGSSSGEPSAPAQSPAAKAWRSSARVTHIASAISPSAGRSGASASATAWKPTMSDRGNGQAWLPR